MAIGYPKRSCALELDEQDVSVSNPLPVTVKHGAGDLLLDAWGTPKTVNPFSLFHSVFTFDISDKLWLKYQNDIELATTTRVSSENSLLKVISGGSVGNSGMACGKRHPRYQPNRGHLFSTACYLPNKTAAGKRDFGLFTQENGVFFRLKSDGNMYAVLRSNSIETKEELITPNFSIDYEKGNIFDIQFQWRGVGNYKFFMGDPATGTIKLVHTFNILGTSTELSLRNPALPASFRSENLGAEVSILVGCVDITSEGGTDEKQYYTSSISTERLVNTNTPILAIQQPTTIGTSVNTRDALLSRVTLNASKRAVVSLYVTRDATAIIGGAWNTIAGSYIKENTSATSVDFAKMSRVTIFHCEAYIQKEAVNPNKDIIQFWLVRGDYLVIVGTASGATVDAVFEFGEEI